MTKTALLPVSRRDLLKGAGALVVAFTVPEEALAAVAAPDDMTRPLLVPEQLDSYIAVRQDGSAIAFFGKTDTAQGVDVAVAQMVADELDLPFSRVEVVMGDTARTVNQGGASGSTGLERGGAQMRNAAAEARRVLVDMAAQKLGVPADQLIVTDGVVAAKDNPGKHVSYGELIGGRYFRTKLDWNGQIGNGLVATGKAKPKAADQLKIVGQSFPRRDIADKVFARSTYVGDVKVPGMVHGRTLRPPVAGAVPTAVDETSIRSIPGARVVWKEGFLGIVANKEWDAIRAARQLKVTWSKPDAAFPSYAELYDHIRKAPVRKRDETVKRGNVDEAMAGAARIVEAEYEWPFQSHSSMGPACALCEVKDGKATLWTGSSKPHYARDGVAKLLGIPVDQVTAHWIHGSGAYGRNDGGDAAMDAAVLADAVKRPVRLQYMRNEGHGWDPKGPASIHRARAGLDANGNVVAYRFESKGFSRIDIDTNESDPRNSLAGQLMGLELVSLDGFGVPAESYGFEHKLLAWETIAPLLARGSPLRTAHLRDPVGPQIQFASESFIDELAHAAGSDPVAFRLKYLKDPRDIAVVKAAAEKANWQPRVAGPQGRASDGVASGRGFAYCQRGKTVVAAVADVEVDLKSGAVMPKHFVVAHDCGLIVNPDALRLCIEGNVVHGASRAILEETMFDTDKVTSVDWATYPILDIAAAPVSVDIVLINRPDLPPLGAGEPSTRPIAAAIANAVFDATGQRIRRAPLTPERVRTGQA
jgi:nicotinate dehydrogenase subunit B